MAGRELTLKLRVEVVTSRGGTDRSDSVESEIKVTFSLGEVSGSVL